MRAQTDRIISAVRLFRVVLDVAVEGVKAGQDRGLGVTSVVTEKVRKSVTGRTDSPDSDP